MLGSCGATGGSLGRAIVARPVLRIRGCPAKPKVYRGVNLLIDELNDSEGRSTWAKVGYVAWTCVDMPFSLVLDTVLLPVNLAIWGSR